MAYLCSFEILILELVLEQPTLFFEVSSIDSWDRHRIEGYGYWKFPWKPGNSNWLWLLLVIAANDLACHAEDSSVL